MRRLLLALIAGAGALAAAEVPRPAPEYAFNLPGGEQINLSRYSGKVVALEFLFTTCPHCQQTSKMIAKLQTEYGKQGFQALGVAINPNPDVRGFVSLYGVNYPLGQATRESAFGFLQQSIIMPNFSVPQLVFIDRKGIIRGQFGGNDAFFANEEPNMRAMIEKLLAEGAPPSSKPVPARRKTS